MPNGTLTVCLEQGPQTSTSIRVTSWESSPSTQATTPTSPGFGNCITSGKKWLQSSLPSLSRPNLSNLERATESNRFCTSSVSIGLVIWISRTIARIQVQMPIHLRIRPMGIFIGQIPHQFLIHCFHSTINHIWRCILPPQPVAPTCDDCESLASINRLNGHCTRGIFQPYFRVICAVGRRDLKSVEQFWRLRIATLVAQSLRKFGQIYRFKRSYELGILNTLIQILVW